MKIALVQSLSINGDIDQNIQHHLSLIEWAIQAEADLIVFPELSITNYEPELAEELACEITDPRFNPFQQLANLSNVTICVGMPIRTSEGINIGMIIFQPNNEQLLYTKKLLHEDEIPFFERGTSQVNLTLGGKKIAFGICYEALQRETFIRATAHQADLFIASVAKPQHNIEHAYQAFPAAIKEFQIPVLMSNGIGACDTFWSSGQSAVWNRSGTLVGNLNDHREGILIYDSETEEATGLYP